MYYGYLIDTTYYYVNNEEKWNLVLTSKDNYFFEKDDSKTSKTSKQESSKQESSKQESSKSNIFSFFKREEPYINDVQVFTKDNETKNILSYKSSSDIITNKNPFLTSLAILVILSSLIFSVYNVINYKNQNNKSLYTRINKKNYKKTLTLVNKDGKVKLKSFKIYKNKYNEIEHILNETPNKDNYFKFMKIKNKNKVGKDNKKYSYTAWQINEDKIPSTVKKYYKSKEKNKKKILKTNSKHKYNTNNKLNKDVDDLINAINKDINKDINKYIY
ncbi:hypothetical protein GSH19_05105 [Lactobacillus sp. S2-2]|uniref:hypothetical protein n=1 Tax=Lactobacillus sp. S2-2 TaxID=2692917 RepID=UPI001F234760|nr:hypothetical protein [Lactobacillus sp. S2-2]MCF6515530.1 hypothetical protein [Lactobacillus sp. S2-2]